MNTRKVKNISIITSAILLTIFAFYFHQHFVYLVNDVIYADSKIPADNKRDLYYFAREKLFLKNITAIGMFILASIVFLAGFRNNNKLVAILVYIQLIIVTISMLGWIMIPAFIL